MAKHVSKGGEVSMGGNAIGNLGQWSLQETASPIPQKDLGDEYQEYSSTDADHPKEWSGSAEAFFDDADTAQAAMTPGAQLALALGPRGTSSTFPRRTGNVIITSSEENGETDGMLRVTFEFIGNGALTRDTYP